MSTLAYRIGLLCSAFATLFCLMVYGGRYSVELLHGDPLHAKAWNEIRVLAALVITLAFLGSSANGFDNTENAIGPNQAAHTALLRTSKQRRAGRRREEQPTLRGHRVPPGRDYPSWWPLLRCTACAIRCASWGSSREDASSV